MESLEEYFLPNYRYKNYINWGLIGKIAYIISPMSIIKHQEINLKISLKQLLKECKNSKKKFSFKETTFKGIK